MLARAFAVGASLIVGVSMAEGLLRLQEKYTPPPAVRAREPELDGLPLIKDVFALSKPDQRANYRGVLYTTNSRGLRNAEIPLIKPPDTFRIAAIGDSYTMGSGVRAEQAYPALLEAVLAGSEGTRRFEVVNLGLSGLSLEQSLNVRVPVGLEYSPDLFLYGFTVNDLEGPNYRAHTRTARVVTGSRLLDLLRERWDYMRDLLWPSPSSYMRELDENYFHNELAWSDFEKALDRLAALARDRDACVVVLIHPQIMLLWPWHPFERHYRAVAQAARQRGMFVVDGAPPFLGQDPARYRCGPYDWHPNAAGHAVLADVLVAGMRRLPSRCWKRGMQESRAASAIH